MIILSVRELSMAFGENIIFENISFEAQHDDKIGFVGVNGSGKTTLFKLLRGELEPESGTIAKSSGLRFGYMEQHVGGTAPTVYEEALTVFAPLLALEAELEAIHSEIDITPTAALIEKQLAMQERFEAEGGLTCRARARSALLGLGFSEEELAKPATVLSGGEASKLQLAKLLLSESRFLLLDEPTNHLDIKACEWLEKFLQEYRGGFIVISHDRYFLDRVTGKTIELENKKMTAYVGNYTEFLHKKEEARKARQKLYDQTVKEIERIEGIIEQQKRWNQAANYVTIAHKQKSIDRLTATLDKPEAEPEPLRFNFRCRDGSGNDVLIVEELALSLGGRELFSGAELTVLRRERVFLLGPNGCGKTSLLRILTGVYSPDFGRISFGARIDVGYYDQAQSGLHPEKTVIDEIWDDFPKMTQTEIRTALGSFLFKGDDVFKKVGSLSGGERARVCLLRLMLGGYNFLLLDEPTNHLDITSREALEAALLAYPGTMLVVSHDRYLINKLAGKIYVLGKTGTEMYTGNYDAYLEEKARRAGRPSAASFAAGTSPGAAMSSAPTFTEEKPVSGEDYRRRKAQESHQRKLAGKIARLEAEIHELEEQQNALHDRLNQPEVAADYEKTTELLYELKAVTETLDARVEQWGELSEALEALRN